MNWYENLNYQSTILAAPPFLTKFFDTSGIFNLKYVLFSDLSTHLVGGLMAQDSLLWRSTTFATTRGPSVSLCHIAKLGLPWQHSLDYTSNSAATTILFGLYTIHELPLRHNILSCANVVVTTQYTCSSYYSRKHDHVLPDEWRCPHV